MKTVCKYILDMSLLAFSAAAQTPADSVLNLSLAACREMALENSDAVKTADNKLLQAELDKKIAFTSYLPNFSGSAGVLYLLEDVDMMGMNMSMKGTYAAGINLVQPLYTGGKIRAGNKLGTIGRECAEENARLERMQTIADADNAYWTYVAVRRKVAMLDSYMQLMDTLLGQTERSVAAEMVTNDDLLRIKAKRSEILYQHQKAVNGLELCRLSLCNAIGADFGCRIVPTDTVMEIRMPSSLDSSIDSRPELKLLQKNVEVQEQQIKMTRADFLPSLALTAGYTYFGNIKINGSAAGPNGEMVPFTQSFDSGFTSAMATLSIPIFHWGEGVKKVKKVKLEQENALLDLHEKSRLMTIEAEQAVRNLSDSYGMVETSGLALEQAEASLRTVRNRYDAGMATLTDLLDAQSQWQQSLSNRIEAQTQFKINETEYLRVTGKLEP